MRKGDDDKISVAEAFINFQIQAKRNEIEEFKEDVALLEGRKQNLIDLRDQIREEQKVHITVLRQQAKEEQRKLEQKGEANKEQVKEALHQTLQLSCNNEKELTELNQVLKSRDEQELLSQAEKKVMLQYKNVGRHKDEEQITHIKNEHSELQKDLEEKTENIHRSLEVTFSEIDKKKVQLVDVKKHLERAIKRLDKKTLQEVKENVWLRKEVALFKKEVSVMEVAVQKLEEENIKLSGELFTQQLEDLQIFGRNIFLTQAGGLESDDSLTLVETLRKMDFMVPTGEHVHGHLAAVQATRDGEEVSRSQPSGLEEGYYRGCSTSAPAAVCEAAWPQDLNGLLYGNQTYFSETVHLGSLAQKLLSVVGQAAPLHTVSSETHCSGGSVTPHD